MAYATVVLTEQLRTLALATITRRERRRKAVSDAAWAVAWGAVLMTLLCLGVR